ncbi:uncharacterized protein LOC117501795 [Thalassophryne amazonica]|uniref:uncharacterized protein LOC117501795 n=1 Tax=Thalassophryne amazonica TaxID=390379 RepID=UPI001471BFFD|nr:uncharacterized protein LOC117501795 [Thalassophryne amazonica]XP_034016647.1 uncharacterized protein LOC117501795 [Thalassophryne amazonica]
MEEGEDFSLSGKAVETEENLRDEYYWKLVADFIGPQTGEGLDLEKAPCKNRLLIQVGLMKEDNNFPWLAITEWLKKIFPTHLTADFRCLIERGIATTLSLGSDARLIFLESEVNFNFVGPICDSIGVERQHLLEMRDFSERAKSIEVTNGLILELSNFVAREKIGLINLVTWLRNFNLEYCKDGQIDKAYKVLRAKIKKLKLYCRSYETRSHRRNTVMENVLQTPFELVPKKADPQRFLVRKRMKREYSERVAEREESDSFENGQYDESNSKRTSEHEESDDDYLDATNSLEEDSLDNRGEALTLLDIAMMSAQKLLSVYNGTAEASKQVSLDLLKNHYALTCKEYPALTDFENHVKKLSKDYSLASPVFFLHSNAHFLVDIHNAVEQQIMSFEQEITQSTGEKLGRDKNPDFKKFVNFSESATSRYIHMACDLLSPRTPDRPNFRKHWVAFCEEKRNPSKLAVNMSNRFNNYFEAAAGLIHHHKEISLFFSDMLSLNNDSCPNVILESVVADADDSFIQSFVCVLAIIYCKIIGPYWQLLKSGGEYALFSQYLLCLYQKFLYWVKDPSIMLEPEEATNVFLQCPLQEKHFDGIFHFCGQWHTNRDLIRACLKRMVKVIAAVTEENLKNFLPGGIFSQIPPPHVTTAMVNCTFSVMMAEYPYGHAYPYKKKRPDRSSKHSIERHSSSASSQEDDTMSSTSADSTDDSQHPLTKNSTSVAQTGDHYHQSYSSIKSRDKKGRGKHDVLEDDRELNMDRDYIIATVNSNGGPCKTQQDLDKMMLRFDGKSRAEKKEAIRCEILYQKMVLNNTDPNLDCALSSGGNMMLKLKLSLPRVKPGYSLVLAPRKTKIKPALKHASVAPAGQGENSSKPS